MQHIQNTVTVQVYFSNVYFQWNFVLFILEYDRNKQIALFQGIFSHSVFFFMCGMSCKLHCRVSCCSKLFGIADGIFYCTLLYGSFNATYKSHLVRGKIKGMSLETYKIDILKSKFDDQNHGYNDDDVICGALVIRLVDFCRMQQNHRVQKTRNNQIQT